MRTLVAIVTLLGLVACKSMDPASQLRDDGPAVSGPPSGGEAPTISFNQSLYQLMTNDFAHVTPLISVATFDALPRTWDAASRQAYDAATDVQEKRRVIANFYGLVMPPASVGSFPMGLTEKNGQLHSNCMICHAGNVFGQPVVGLGNNRLDFESFIEDSIKIIRGSGAQLTGWLSQFDLAKRYKVSFGQSRGTTAPLTFAGILSSLREDDLEHKAMFRPERLASLESSIIGTMGRFLPESARLALVRRMLLFSMPDIDLDAPAWWGVRASKRLYHDGLIDKGPTVVLQFLADPWATAEQIKSKEPAGAAFLENIQTSELPPTYAALNPDRIRQDLVTEGAAAFRDNCTSCHGEYGQDASGDHYPERLERAQTIGTDPLRANELSDGFRRFLDESWFGKNRQLRTTRQPNYSYRAPYLRRIAYTYPYFHNGAVPTLYHVLFPEKRPVKWRVTDGFDHDKMGFSFVADGFPDRPDPRTHRQYFDSSLSGKSKDGHNHMLTSLSPEKRLAILEYLKTL